MKNPGFLALQLKIPIHSNLEEFIIHALKFAFPAEAGPLNRGMTTAHSAPPIVELIAGNDEIYV